MGKPFFDSDQGCINKRKKNFLFEDLFCCTLCFLSSFIFKLFFFALLFRTSGQLISISISSAISLASVLTELNPISLYGEGLHMVLWDGPAVY